MLPIAHIGISPESLWSIVREDRWSAWTAAEPALRQLRCLKDLRCLRGSDEDPLLGALLRLAATDGGDDELAAIAVVHQLEPAVQKLVCQFRNLAGQDVDGVVVGTLWVAVRSFAWRTRKRSYAAALIHDTRAGVLSLLLPDHTRSGTRQITFLDPLAPFLGVLIERSSGPSTEDDFEPDQLADLLRWAQASGAVSREDATLLLELVDADRHNRSLASPQWNRGPCSVAAVQEVANRRGVHPRTITRARDAVIARLRAASHGYLADVA